MPTKTAVISTVVGAAIGTVLASAAVHAAGDPTAGKVVFKKCAICHTAEQGKNKVGPSLFGIVGRHSASIPDFRYSDAMKAFNRTWDEATLNTYLTDPRQVIPGTKMVFPGLKEQKERDDLVAYLETLK